jgi:hypothetical protein
VSTHVSARQRRDAVEKTTAAQQLTPVRKSALVAGHEKPAPVRCDDGRHDSIRLIWIHPGASRSRWFSHAWVLARGRRTARPHRATEREPPALPRPSLPGSPTLPPCHLTCLSYADARGSRTLTRGSCTSSSTMH